MKDCKRKCLRCGSTPENHGVVLYRFPRPGVTNILRCEAWAQYIFPDKPLVFSRIHRKLFSEHRMLCHKHFKATSFIDYAAKKLHRHAVPDKECDEIATQNSVQPRVLSAAPGPSRVLLDITNTLPESQTRGSQFPELEQDDTELVNRQGNPSAAGSYILMEHDYISSIASKTSSKILLNPELKLDETEFVTQSENPSTSQVAHVLVEHNYYKMNIVPSTSTMDIQNPELDQVAMIPTSSMKRQCDSEQKRLRQESKSRKYYEKCRKAMKKLCYLRNSIKKKKMKEQLRIIAEDDVVKYLEKKISPTFALLLQGEIKNYKRRPRGRRWSREDKIVALRIYKRSPTCYRLLRRLFCLPAPSCLKKMLSEFSLPPGLNQSILKSIKKATHSQKPSDQQFILMFDEMSIKKHLDYNKKTDEIEGFQDHGEHGRTSQEAVKALVFMVSGIRKAYKQPLAYYLSGANVTADRLAVLIKQMLRQCFNAGIKVSATVCDMGGTNRRALSSLGATEKCPVIKIDDKEVITLFDTPHLLKCFRNMFLKYNIKCKADITSSDMRGEGLAKWNDIKEFFEQDNSNPNFVFAPSLRKDHIEPNTKQKMRVNLAAQVFSHTVAAGIFSYVSEGKLPASAAVTATVVSKIDKLYDLVNSSTPDLRRGKPHATNMSDSSPHKLFFNEMKVFFKSMTFVGCPRSPPSLDGWIWTLNGLEMLWVKLRNQYPDIRSLSTRRLQQDPLENLFGCIRGNCGSNVNPTTSAFVGGIKTAILSNLAHISSGNCEEDNNKIIIENFNELLSTTAKRSDEGSEEEECFDVSSNILPDSDKMFEETSEMQACAYVCGFLLKHNKILETYAQCKTIFQAEPELVHNFVTNKEYFENKKCLNYASQNFIVCVENCAMFINQKLSENAAIKKLKKRLINNIDENNFTFIKKCTTHYQKNVEYIKSSVFYICVKRYCIVKNRTYAEEASNTSLKKKINILKNQ